MDISATGRSGYTPLPIFQDMAVVLAARSSVAQMSAQTAQVSAKADDAAAGTRAATGGTVDMYL
jgi:hypothetical protein